VESGSTQFYVGKCSAREAKPAVSITWEDDKGTSAAILTPRQERGRKRVIDLCVLVSRGKWCYYSSAKFFGSQMGTQINLGRALTAIEKTTRAGLTAETSSELRIDTVRRNEHQQVKNE